MLYFGFAIADGMFPPSANGVWSTIRRVTISPEEAADRLRSAAEARGLVSCLNPSHRPTIAAMRDRFGIDFVEIPKYPTRVELKPGDHLIVMSVRGLPRLTDRHEYSAEEIESAEFSFSLYVFLGADWGPGE